MCPSAVPTVPVGPFHVSDLAPSELPAVLVQQSLAQQRATLAFALHVGGLNSWRDDRVVSVLNKGDLLYADGISVVLIARLAGAKGCARSPTTDVGWAVVDELARSLGRTIKIALIGGRPGLARAAGRIIADRSDSSIVGSLHGYQQDWKSAFETIAKAEPDLVIVGLGMPREAEIAVEYADILPACLLMTCGGWFGFLTGEERRASTILQRMGLEWIFRLMQSPRRLIRRYSTGVCSTAILSLVALSRRHRIRSKVDRVVDL